jgi:hypothetical protein
LSTATRGGTFGSGGRGEDPRLANLIAAIVAVA